MPTSWIIALLMVGLFLTVDGFYRDEIAHLRRNPKVEYRFIPRDTIAEAWFTAAPVDFQKLPPIISEKDGGSAAPPPSELRPDVIAPLPTDTKTPPAPLPNDTKQTAPLSPTIVAS